MAINLIKKYDAFLEINHFTEAQRKVSLRAVFDRDIADNEDFNFRTKIIRPLKKEDVEKDKRGKVIKTRNVFDFERSKRLHWILPHINELITSEVEVFSSNNRIDGKDVIRTYIHNKEKEYVIILEPQSSGIDYYFITAYYLEKKYGGPNMIKNKFKNRLPIVY